MRTIRTGIFFILLLALPAAAQFGPFTVTGTQCATVQTNGQATVAFQVVGATWTGTIQPQVAVDGLAYVNSQVTPAASSTPQGTVTANGAYFLNVAGYSQFQLCGATVTSTATIYINVSRFTH